MGADAATIHGITATEDPDAVPLGPTITAEVEFEGFDTLVLLDTVVQSRYLEWSLQWV